MCRAYISLNQNKKTKEKIYIKKNILNINVITVIYIDIDVYFIIRSIIPYLYLYNYSKISIIPRLNNVA